ncbi:developmental pluripotency associated 1 (predicted), isoform CRA_b [Rattus norvegicus]|uniref:Developmental pluripotency associated 1 (Predicted), isoform CRA_b n=1 Tax=Rattus norvegicus TaxID=10116 RepID=A6HDS5_RAT|nr:developmental pluripotency associated 1 (predicted), isoform CRA_b [Rattus norvegicus]
MMPPQVLISGLLLLLPGCGPNTIPPEDLHKGPLYWNLCVCCTPDPPCRCPGCPKVQTQKKEDPGERRCLPWISEWSFSKHRAIPSCRRLRHRRQ